MLKWLQRNVLRENTQYYLHKWYLTLTIEHTLHNKHLVQLNFGPMHGHCQFHIHLQTRNCWQQNIRLISESKVLDWWLSNFYLMITKSYRIAEDNLKFQLMWLHIKLKWGAYYFRLMHFRDMLELLINQLKIIVLIIRNLWIILTDVWVLLCSQINIP